ncbi:MAG: Fe-S cluster assembly sulfur transfer protein SufU [Myxococcota bacterium]
MSKLEDLYQTTLLAQAQRTGEYPPVADATHRVKKTNPLCGDRIELTVSVEDGRIALVGFKARGCAISLAAATSLCDELKGAKVADAQKITEDYLAMLRDGGPMDRPRLHAFDIVREFPSRVRCATLAFEGLDELLR